MYRSSGHAVRVGITVVVGVATQRRRWVSSLRLVLLRHDIMSSGGGWVLLFYGALYISFVTVIMSKRVLFFLFCLVEKQHMHVHTQQRLISHKLQNRKNARV